MTFPASMTTQVLTHLFLCHPWKWERCYPHVSYIQSKQSICPRSQKKPKGKPGFAYRFLKYQIAQYFNKSIYQFLLCLNLCENSYTGRTKQNILATSLEVSNVKRQRICLNHIISTLWTVRRESDSKSITHKGLEHLTAVKISDKKK